MKCLTRADAEARYGHIDFASKYWPNQGMWISMFKVPDGWFPNWTVLDTGLVVRHIACNIDIHVPLANALADVKAKGLEHELHTFDGCFNIRAVRGSTLPSTHSYGLGLDFNAATEPMGTNTTHWTPAFIKCFTEQEFDWGGNFTGRKDSMHLSRAWEHHG